MESMKLRLAAAVCLAGSLAAAQETPAVWGYLPRNPKGLMGFNIERFGQSVQEFGQDLGARMGLKGKATRTTSRSPEEFLAVAGMKEVVLSLPEQVGVATGNFTIAALRRSVAGRKVTEERYKNALLFLDPATPKQSVALVDPGTLLLGDRAALETMIDRGPAPGPHPLYARSRRLAAANEVWVIATDWAAVAKDVPLGQFDAEDLAGVREVELGMTFAKGIGIDAAFLTQSPAAAQKLAAKLRSDAGKDLPPGAPLADAIRIGQQDERVTMQFDFDFAALFAEMGKALAQGVKQGVEEMGRPMQNPQARPAGRPPAAAARPEEPAPPAKPGVIRIHGLDEGPREIKVEPRKP
jgi:hypothetical protein